MYNHLFYSYCIIWLYSLYCLSIMSLFKYFFESDDSPEDEADAVEHWIKTGLDFEEMPEKPVK